MRRTLPLLLALLAACANDEGIWSTYQAAGEAAAIHARYEKAEGLLERALAETTERPAERVRTQIALARVARERGDFGAARARLAEAAAGAQGFGPDAPEAARLALEEAWLVLDEGAAGEAAVRFESAERSAKRLLGPQDPAVGWALAGRGEALRRAGDRAGARAALDDALALFAGAASADHVRPGEPLGELAALTSLGALLREEGDLAGAREALLAGSAIGGRELGADHPRVAATLVELSRVEAARGDRAAASRAATRAAEIARARLPEGHATRRAADAALAELALAPAPDTPR